MGLDKNERMVQEQALWQGLCDGQPEAFDGLIRSFSKSLFGYGSRFCQDRDLVKDCLQELFVELWNKRSSLPLPRSVKGYLFIALRNRVLREQGRWHKRTSLEEENFNFLVEYSIEEQIIAHTEDLELARKIKMLLDRLPARQKEIVYLRYYENLDYDAIASLMQINKQSVHNLLQKAYKSIRVEWVPLICLLHELSLARQ
ncbi:RNA polymerase subunit sigma-24 [Pedobacter yulinensis]|uniref:RNA polymerase subunit sigma-24 n=1 Tax=Pedobacter yulinensis TaxID=2126353 RepID=A0A2T3HN94_9SPHI|nr:sigma-70 family RNA polymerase sigma factor [Pedobacter yulinensis]PST83928.1 RNA polymerase subunit sigma-24 [Pedobacter yulinensis]